ncbi:MAG: tetrahydromethanopterin S-methyltransferase subunit A [Candidatus Nezhaarchaeales archaeon]
MDKPKYRFPPGSKWPPLPGDYVVGDPESAVAICTLSSRLEVKAPYAIRGACRTENVGIERVIVNIVSNPNIRFLILCGREVVGHEVGGCFKALKRYGVDRNSRRIINAPGPLPVIGGIPLEAVERFREQVELVDLIGVEDTVKIAKEVYRCIERDPGAYPKPPLRVEATLKPMVKGGLNTVTIAPEYGLSVNLERWEVEYVNQSKPRFILK